MSWLMIMLLQKSARLEEIHTAEDLVSNLEVIEAPSQIISALEHTSLQKYMMLKSDESMKKRLDHWLTHFFEEELSSMNEAGNFDGRLTEVLGKLLSYTQYTKVSPSTSPKSFFCLHERSCHLQLFHFSNDFLLGGMGRNTEILC